MLEKERLESLSEQKETKEEMHRLLDEPRGGPETDSAVVIPTPPFPLGDPEKLVPRISGAPRTDAQRRADSVGAILIQFRLLWTPFVTKS